jgi:hypothetical protein
MRHTRGRGLELLDNRRPRRIPLFVVLEKVAE